MAELTNAEFNKIRDYIKQTLGISLSDEKRTLVQSRLKSTLMELGMKSFSEYFEYLLKDRSGDALTRFVNKITTNHTFFMREADHFDFLAKTVLPYVTEEFQAGRDLRMWCAASSTGEEAVTLQIIVSEHFKKIKDNWNTQMLATDVSANVLDRAVAGRYLTEALENLPAAWKTEYFRKIDDSLSQVSEAVLKQIVYRRLNLLDPFRFKKKFHIIFCRNVMIYFDAKTRDAVVQKFYDVTEPGGYLFVGHSESVSSSGTGYQFVKPAVYIKPK